MMVLKRYFEVVSVLNGVVSHLAERPYIFKLAPERSGTNSLRTGGVQFQRDSEAGNLPLLE